MDILLKTKYKISDTVINKLKPENKMIVVGYTICSVDPDGFAQYVLIDVCDGDGENYNYREWELEKI